MLTAAAITRTLSAATQDCARNGHWLTSLYVSR